MSELTDKQTRLAALIKIRDSGVASLRNDTQRVDYRSMSEVITAIATLQGEVAELLGSTASRGPKYLYQSCKGL
jgi:hypothetical protein